MLRIAPLRTGVEILASEHTGLVPLPASVGALPAAFPVVAQWVVHPDLWTHELLDATGDRIGLLLLCAPGPAAEQRFTAVQAALPDPDDLYLGLRPGEEHWLWFDDPWPATFQIRGREYPTQLDPAQWTVTERQAHRISPFAPQSTATPIQAQQTWVIRTGGSDTGHLARRADGAQQWWARTAFLFQRLIPPGPDGVWRFEPSPPLSAPPTGMVPIDAPDGLLPTIDLSGRTL